MTKEAEKSGVALSVLEKTSLTRGIEQAQDILHISGQSLDRNKSKSDRTIRVKNF